MVEINNSDVSNFNGITDNTSNTDSNIPVSLALQETDLISVNDMMIQQGHGYSYDGGTKQKFV